MQHNDAVVMVMMVVMAVGHSSCRQCGAVSVGAGSDAPLTGLELIMPHGRTFSLAALLAEPPVPRMSRLSSSTAARASINNDWESVRIEKASRSYDRWLSCHCGGRMSTHVAYIQHMMKQRGG